MSNEWLSAQNFERSYRVVSAINTISIHEKLKVAGVNDEERNDEVREARSHLLEFLKNFERIVLDAEKNPDYAVDGVDPRLGELARSFLNAKKQRPSTSALVDVSPHDLSRLIESSDAADRERLVKCLRDFRRLVEDHVHADVVKIL